MFQVNRGRKNTATTGSKMQNVNINLTLNGQGIHTGICDPLMALVRGQLCCFCYLLEMIAEECVFSPYFNKVKLIYKVHVDADIVFHSSHQAVFELEVN